MFKINEYTVYFIIYIKSFGEFIAPIFNLILTKSSVRQVVQMFNQFVHVMNSIYDLCKLLGQLGVPN